jgi:hypothetical protein
MPAIHIDRLVQQLNSIFEPESPGPIFRENFKSLLEVHANLAYRAGQDIQRKSSISKYHLAPIVNHHIQNQFSSLAKNKPELALEYADQLWTQNFYEMKYFAAIILGSLSKDMEPEILKRFIDWGSKTTEKEIHQVLFHFGTQNIRQTSTNKWLETIQTWIDSSEILNAITAIYALQTLVSDEAFQNLPKVFMMISPLFSIKNRKITSTLTWLIQDLAEINPIETAHYLSNLLLSSSYTAPRQIVRKSLKFFPPSDQKKLRFALSNAPEIE